MKTQEGGSQGCENSSGSRSEWQHTTVINELSGMEGRLVTEENKVMELVLGHEHPTVSENGWPLKYIQLESPLDSLFTVPFE